MSSVFNRGTKDRPRFFVRYRDAAGVWRSRRTQQETKREAVAVARQLEAQEERRRLGLEAPASAALSVRELMERWTAALRNRAARNDKWRIDRHLVPRFGALRIVELTLAVVMVWLDELAAAAAMKASSQRGLLTLLSRFCSWAVDRGYLQANPCKAIPSGRRPQAAQRTDVPWIADDALVVRALELLPEPIRYLFFLGNRCGLRTGEAAGVRMSDLMDMDRGTIRVRFSYLGPLKEDKSGAGKTKYVPAPIDCTDVLGPWWARRDSEGAAPEDLVFPREGRFTFRKEHAEYHWRRAREALGLPTMTWYQATRHSFASRNLAAGVSMDEVSQAMGHSSVAITQKHYAHFVRKTFAAQMTAPLDRGGGAGRIIPIGAARAPAVAPAPQAGQADEPVSVPNPKARRAGGR